MVLAVWVYMPSKKRGCMASEALFYTQLVLVYMALKVQGCSLSGVPGCSLLEVQEYNSLKVPAYNPLEVPAYRALVLSVYMALWAQDDRAYNPFGILVYGLCHIHMSDSSEYTYRSFWHALLSLCTAF